MDQRGTMRKSDDSNHGNAHDNKQESDEEDEQAHDEVRLWEDGFKDRYYESKFDVAADNVEFRYGLLHFILLYVIKSDSNVILGIMSPYNM